MNIDNKINFNIIAKRVEEYGNNFPEVAELWSGYLDEKISPKDVSLMMVLLKQSRAKNDIGKDSISDLINYKWIGNHYQDYEKLVNLVETKNEKSIDKFIKKLNKKHNKKEKKL